MKDPTPIANLLRIAFYAGGLLEELEDCEAGRDGDASFVELFGRMVAKSAWRIRRGGYQRGYLDVEERLSRPRGRLLLAESIATASLARRQLWCAHDEFGLDTQDNRVLRAVVQWLLAAGRRGQLGDDTVAQLEQVQADLATVAAVRLERRMLGRLPGGIPARRYRVVRYVARLLAEHAEPDGEGSGDQGIRLLQDPVLMRRIFERFIYRFARHNKPAGTKVGRGHYEWSGPAGREAMVPKLIPDAVLRSPSAARVIECKYTDTILVRGPHGAAPALRSAHLQQLFCYLAAEHRRGRPVTGLLVYPRVGEAVRVATKLGDHDVVVTTLDLALPWPELTARLRAEVFGGLAGCE